MNSSEQSSDPGAESAHVDLPFTQLHSEELNAILEQEDWVARESMEATQNRLAGVVEERRSFAGGEIIRLRPEKARIDPSTGAPVIPLVFVQGMASGDEKLPQNLAAFAADQREIVGLQYQGREIVGLQYQGKLRGKADPAQVDGQDASVSEIDVDQAGDLLSALDELGIDQVDMVAVSRGGVRAQVAMGLAPKRFRNVYLAHSAGLDGRTYREAHVDAARAAVLWAVDKARGKVEKSGAGQPIPRGRGLLRDLHGARIEQKSVARAQTEGILAGALAASPDLRVIVAGDRSDRAFRPERLEETIRGSGATFIETDWGGHGIGGNPKAVAEIIASMHQMEEARVGA